MEDPKRATIKVAIPVERALGSSSPSIRNLAPERGLEAQGPSFKIPTNEDAAAHVDETHGKHSWQAKILKFIHQKWFQHLIMGLLMLDILILFTELFLMSMFPHCSIIVRDAFSCCPHEEEARWLETDSHSDSHSDICEAPLEVSDYQAGCDTHKWHAVHTLEDVLFGITIGILSIMMIELLLLVAALSPCVFFRHFWYALDFFIVAVSLALEACFKTLDDDQLATYVGILVLFRCWRFVRISHGLIEVTHELTAAKYEEAVQQAIELEDLLAAHEQKMAAQGIDDSDDTESVREITLKSKDLADQLLATQDEDKDEMHLVSDIKEKSKSMMSKITHSGHHKSGKNKDGEVSAPVEEVMVSGGGIACLNNNGGELEA